MIVITLDDILFLALILIAIILFVFAWIFGWLANIGEKIIRRGCVGKDEEETEQDSQED